jgi:hypothetical protein
MKKPHSHPHRHPHPKHDKPSGRVGGDIGFIQGAGRLRFTSISPAGTGRKVYIPLYLTTATGGYQALTDTGLAAISTTCPTITLAAPAAAGATGTATLVSPQISWALLRFVGFVTSIQTPVLPSLPPMDITFSDLRLGGSTNLFVHEDFASGDLYEIGNSNPGFRYYPILRSPNTMTVQVQGIGMPTSAATAFSCAIMCDILDDDQYGMHISGPYARRDTIQSPK